MNGRKNIIIFDSGIGGFTALMHAADVMPQENFLFYADTKNVPYGDKPLDVARALTQQAARDIALNYDPKALVIACNTATSAAAVQLREEFSFPVIGMEPAIKPALLAIDNGKKSGRVLLLSTKLTMQGMKLTNLLSELDTKNRVDCLPLSGLVDFAENLEFSGENVERYLLGELSRYNLDEYGAVILGCTHFIWYRELLGRILPDHIRLFDGNGGTIRQLRRRLSEENALAPEDAAGQREILLHFTGGAKQETVALLSAQIPFPVKVV